MPPYPPDCLKRVTKLPVAVPQHARHEFELGFGHVQPVSKAQRTEPPLNFGVRNRSGLDTKRVHPRTEGMERVHKPGLIEVLTFFDPSNRTLVLSSRRRDESQKFVGSRKRLPAGLSCLARARSAAPMTQSPDGSEREELVLRLDKTDHVRSPAGPGRRAVVLPAAHCAHLVRPRLVKKRAEATARTDRQGRHLAIMARSGAQRHSHSPIAAALASSPSPVVRTIRG